MSAPVAVVVKLGDKSYMPCVLDDDSQAIPVYRPLGAFTKDPETAIARLAADRPLTSVIQLPTRPSSRTPRRNAATPGT